MRASSVTSPGNSMSAVRSWLMTSLRRDFAILSCCASFVLVPRRKVVIMLSPPPPFADFALYLECMALPCLCCHPCTWIDRSLAIVLLCSHVRVLDVPVAGPKPVDRE